MRRHRILRLVGITLTVMQQIWLGMSPAVAVPPSTDHFDSTARRLAGFQPKRPNYVTDRSQSHAPVISSHAPVIRVYQDFIPFEGRDQATLLALGKILGDDYFIHPVSDLSTGIPADTAVVLITSNSAGSSDTAAAQNDPAAQANLDAFLQLGGTLIVDMGDNLDGGGFIAPGSVGTPNLIFPDNCVDATLAPAALGPDGILGTADDHPIIKGPDGIAGTGDDLNDSNIDTVNNCFVALGNLVDGITLPPTATLLMTATFAGVEKPILASVIT
jgi:hypothetical protein